MKPYEQIVTEALLLMAEVLANPKEVTPELAKAWSLVLRQAGVRPEEIADGTARILSQQTFFPTPADFVKALRPVEDREVAEELAWQRTLTALRRFGGLASLSAADFGGDAAALWAVERMGWERFSRELTEENRAIWRAEFVRIYRVARSTGAACHYLAGWYERQNTAEGRDLRPELVGRPDWKELPALPDGEEPQSRELQALADVVGQGV